MNILRIIKLKQIYDEFEYLTSQEKLFFQLHVNLHEISAGELYNNYDEWVVHYDFENNRFWYSQDRFYIIFKNKFSISKVEFRFLCEDILKKYLNLENMIPM